MRREEKKCNEESWICKVMFVKENDFLILFYTNTDQRKKLWKNPEFLGLKFENANFNIICLENNKSSDFDVKVVAKDFSLYFSNLAENRVSKLFNLSNKQGLLSVARYYGDLQINKKLDLLPTRKDFILKREIDTSKTTFLENLQIVVSMFELDHLQSFNIFE